MRRFACERWFRGTLVPVLLLGWLLLPVLFQTRMGFQSGARWAWEWSYFALTALAAAGLRRYRWNGRGGLWCALLSPAAALGAAFCQNVLLGGALAVLAVALV